MSIIKNGVELFRALISDGVTDVEVDVFSKNLGTISTAHKRVHGGMHYEIVDYMDLASAASREFIFVTPDTTTFMHFVHELSFEKESTVIFTEGVATSDDGTLITSFNNNRNSLNTASMVVTHTPTNVTGGTVILQHRLGDGNKAGGLSRGENELILKRNTKYSLIITNESAQNSLTNWDFEWYEAG